jgi:hypothetical protein
MTLDGGSCPTTDCYGLYATEGGPCTVGEDALWTCNAGVSGDYEFISANCPSTGQGTPLPQFCCPRDFIAECLGIN